jgi:hypothetical protein
MTGAFGIDRGVIDGLFEGFDPESEIGPIHVLQQGREIMAVRFEGEDYLVYFISPAEEMAENDDGMVDHALEVVGEGFQPAASSRLVKFCRRDAIAELASMFDPDAPGNKAKLPPGVQAGELCLSLANAIRLHSQTEPLIDQYIFWVDKRKLKRLYDLAWRLVQKTPVLQPLPFRRIMAGTGELHVYERT